MTVINRRAFLKTTALLGSSLTLTTCLTGCNSQKDSSDSGTMRFAVISDPHIYDPSLGITGQAFEDYLHNDRKMLIESTEILSAMVDQLLQDTQLDVLLIPGDLTKDGELLCHKKIIEILKPLYEAGIKIFVIPGNHDINNPHAVSFSDGTTESVDCVNADEFASLYTDFGYKQAIYRDENSLSYIVEPVTGVWLVALDSCKYQDNLSLGTPETSGALSDDLLGWLQPLLEEAKIEGKMVFGMLHHGLVAHFASQATIFSEYLIDDYESVGAMLASYGLNLVFTGHFHAQDVAMADYNGDGLSVLYDVETGSSVTAPCPYRLIDLEIASQTFNINSVFINSIPSITDFSSYKDTFISEGMVSLYTTQLAQMGLSGDTLSNFANLAATLHIAHYNGDEETDVSTLATINALVTSEDANTAYLGNFLLGLAIDPGLADNQLAFSLGNETTAILTLFKRMLNRKMIAV